MNFDNSRFPRKFNNNNFQWRLTPNTEKEIVFKNNEKIQLTPINLEIKTLENFDLETFTKMCESDDADIEKIKAYLEKCGIEYEISDDGKTISVKNAVVNNCKIPKMDFQIREASETNTTENKTDIKTLVNQYVETWVNDFKTSYKRWGLESAPTEAQIKTFKETLTNACADTTSLKDTTEEGVKVWVRAQANVAITQVKFDNYYDSLVDMFAKSFADFGLDSNLTGDELKQVKDAFEKAYKAGLNTHVASINAKGDHQIESNSDLQTWFKSLLTEALKPVKTARSVKAGEVTVGHLRQWHLLGSPYFEQTDHGTFKLKSGFYIGTEEIKTVQQLLDALQNKKTITTEPVKESPTTPTTSSTTTTDNTEAYAKLANAAQELEDDIKSGDKLSKVTKFCPVISAYVGDNNVWGEDSNGDLVFRQMLKGLKNANTGLDEDTIAKLLKTAWVRAVENCDARVNIEIETVTFTSMVLANLSAMLKNLQSHPENLQYFIGISVDATGIETYNTTTKVDCRNFVKYDTGESHLVNDNDDKKFQAAMQQLLENIYKQYPNVDKNVLKQLFNRAQENTLSDINQGIVPMTASGISGSANAEMKSLIDMVVYKFNNIMSKALINTRSYSNKKLLENGTFKARGEETETKAPKSNQTDAQNTAYKEGAAGLKSIITNAREIRNLVSSCNEASRADRNPNVTDGYMHTEFGIDGKGNIVFQEKATTRVYNNLVSYLTDWVKESASDAYNKIGEKNFKLLIQSAWIMAYNSFDSSKYGGNKVEDFIKKVMENISKMLDKLKTNPELMEAYTKRTSYADTSLTNGLRHYGTNTTYGNDQNIYYQGTITQHKDGTVHISQTNDDNDYQTTMNELLTRVIAKYPSIDSKVVTNVFREAQKAALKSAQNKTEDCPYGTGNNSSKVEDNSRNWGGFDSRNGDNGYITMDRLVQLTLYYFDKLLMQELTK